MQCALLLALELLRNIKINASLTVVLIAVQARIIAGNDQKRIQAQLLQLQENVFGLHCSECRTGTFALRAINPLGCIPCFCSGMSEFCSEVEDHVRIPVSKAIASSVPSFLLHFSLQASQSCTISPIYELPCE